MITEQGATSTRMHRWQPVLALLFVVIALAAWGSAATAALRFDRAAIASGEWYRLVTGHLVHLGWKHALLNGAGLLLLPLVAPEPVRRAEFLFRCLVIGAGVGFLLLLRQPTLQWYVGMSGVLHGLYFLALLQQQRKRDLVAGGVLLMLVGKVVWEHYHGPLQFSRAMLDQPVIVAAHTYGIAVAIPYAALAAAISSFTASRKKAS